MRSIRVQTVVVVEARDDDGNPSVGTGQLTIDFDCPSFVALSLTPAIADPGMSVVLAIEASESLAELPRVTRNGRDWEPAVGSGASYTVTHHVTLEDPAQRSNVVVRLVDRAGNTSDDCGGDGVVPFAVDHTPPIAATSSILLERDAPGRPSVISAPKGSFQDDVGIAYVKILDETGTRVIAMVTPDEDGSLPKTGLGATTDSRVQVEAMDLFGRVSPRSSVRSGGASRSAPATRPAQRCAPQSATRLRRRRPLRCATAPSSSRPTCSKWTRALR